MAVKKKTLKSTAKVSVNTPSIRDMEKRISSKSPTIKNPKGTPKIKNSVIGAVGKNSQSEKVSNKQGVVSEAKLTVNKPKRAKRKKQDPLWWTKY